MDEIEELKKLVSSLEKRVQRLETLKKLEGVDWASVTEEEMENVKNLEPKKFGIDY